MNPNKTNVFLRSSAVLPLGDLAGLAGNLLPDASSRSWKQSLRSWSRSLGFESSPRTERHAQRILEEQVRGLREESIAAFELEDMGQIQIEARKGRLIRANRAFCELLGFAQEDLLSRPLLDLAVPQDRPECKQGLAETARGMRQKWNAELRFLRKDGREVRARLTGVLVRGNDSLPLRIVASVLDVTAQRRTEARLKEAEEKLRSGERLEAVGRTAGTAVHDLNNLIASMQGFSELIALRAGAEEKSRDYAFEISRCARRASTLINAILNPESDREPGDGAVDLNRLVLGVCRMLQGQLGEGIRLTSMTSENPPMARADAERLERILFNLAANARDAMPLGGDLAIRAFSRRMDGVDIGQDGQPIPPGAYACIEVQDTGHGMDEAALERLFKVFRTTKGPKGTGLGLAAVRKLMAEAGGHIQVASAKGHGTRFLLLFPQARAAATVGVMEDRGV